MFRSRWKPISQDRYVNGSIDNDGLFDSSKINEISIKNNNTSGQLSNARTSLDRNVFLGHSVNLEAIQFLIN